MSTLRNSSGSGTTPDAPDASSVTWSLVDMQPSESSRSKLTRVAAREGGIQFCGRNVGVGRDHDQHRREARREHARTLRHAADGVVGGRRAVAGAHRALRLAVGGHDRKGCVFAVIAESRRRCGHPGEEHVAVELIADETGRAHEHIARARSDRLRDRFSRWRAWSGSPAAR